MGTKLSKSIGTITQITTNAADYFNATFSANGNTIAYDAYDSTAELEQLYTVSAVAPYTVTEINTPALEAQTPVFSARRS